MDDKDKKIYEFLTESQFSCQRCSDCCRIEPGAVFLTVRDVKKITDFLKMPLDDFINEYCRALVRSGKIVLSLKEKLNYDCIFWDGKCIIYNARPLQCRTYPFWPSIVESKKEWNNEAKRCKGINKEGNLTLEQKFELYKKEKNASLMELKPKP